MNINSRRAAVTSSISVFVLALTACGQSTGSGSNAAPAATAAKATSSAPVSAALPAPPSQKLRTAAEQLAKVAEAFNQPTAIRFTSPVPLRTFEELANAPYETTSWEAKKAFERINEVAGPRVGNELAPELYPDREAVQRVLDLQGASQLSEAKGALSSISNALIRTAFTKWIAAMAGESSPVASVTALAAAADVMPFMPVYTMLAQVAQVAPLSDPTALAKYVEAGGGVKEVAKKGFAYQMELVRLRELGVTQNMRPSSLLHEGKEGVTRPMTGFPQLMRDAIAKSWEQVRTEEKAPSENATALIKGEFETTAAFDARKAKVEATNAQEANNMLESRQRRFTQAFKGQLASLAPWRLSNIAYDADSEMFTASIDTFTQSLGIPASFSVPRGQAQQVKAALSDAMVTPTVTVRLDGTLTVPHAYVLVNEVQLSARLSWDTGIAISEVSNDAYVTLKVAAQAEQDAKAALEAEAQRKVDEARIAKENAELAKQRVAQAAYEAAHPGIERCLQKVQAVYGTVSSGNLSNMAASVQRQAQEAENCRAGGAPPIDVEGNMYARAEQIQARGGYACNGIGMQIKQVVQAQGVASPYIARLLNQAAEHGCL